MNYSYRILFVFQFITLIYIGKVFSNSPDSGWVNFIHQDSTSGLYTWMEPGVGNADPLEDPNNLVEVVDSVLYVYPDGRHQNQGGFTPFGYISTQKRYGYYQLQVELKFGANNYRDNWNSGLFLHTQRDMELDGGGNYVWWPPTIELQFQKDNAGQFWLLNEVWITKDGQGYGGGRGSNVPREGVFNDPNDWNLIEVTFFGDSAWFCYINGNLVNYGNNAEYQNSNGQRVPMVDGKVQLEIEGSQIMYRNFKIRETIGCMDTQALNFATWAVKEKDPSDCEYPEPVETRGFLNFFNVNILNNKVGIEVIRSGDYQLRVSNLLGDVIYLNHSSIVNHTIFLNTGRMYFIHYESSSGRQVKKVILP